MKKKSLIVVSIIGIIAVGYTIYYNFCLPSYSYTPVSLPATFDEYYKNKLAESARLKVRPGNEERLVRYAPGKTPIAILYIHGYGACRAEGEYILDKVAARLKANTYYLRLPGHGTNKEDHLNARAKDHLDTVITALMMMDKLGDKIIVVGTSMGGLISTYLAAHYPEKMAGVVLVSPFYNFPDAVSRLVNHYPIFRLYVALNPMRISSSPVPPQEDNWTKYWYREQYYLAATQLIDLERMIARDPVYEKITIPVLLIYYYKDKNNQDKTASVAHMLHAFERFGRSSSPNPLNRAVRVENGAHVLMSKYDKTDEALVTEATYEFIRDAAGITKK